MPETRKAWTNRLRNGEVGSAMSPKNLICNTGKVAKAERFSAM
jgi:hypothetical protein